MRVPTLLRRPLRHIVDIPSHRCAPRLRWSVKPWCGQVDSRHRSWMGSSQPGSYPGAEVAAVSEIALIPEHVDHEPVPYLSDLAVGEAALRRRPREPETWQRRRHNAEGEMW